MIQISNVKLPLTCKPDDYPAVVAKKLQIKQQDLLSCRLVKRSVDARNKKHIHFNASFWAEVKNEEQLLQNRDVKQVTNQDFQIQKARMLPKVRPLVIGAGPAGLFCAYVLAQAGLHPIVIERGQEIAKRVEAVERFWKTGILNPESNVQFGEGGAGTFSDGKLNTGIKDPRIAFVLKTFADCGAPKEILWQQKPHIGTDRLRETIVNLRNKIVSLGGEIRFETRFLSFSIQNGKIHSAVLQSHNLQSEIPCEKAVLAIGHSARDTFRSVYLSKIPMTAKPFAVGVRIEHTQAFINQAQYGKHYPKHLLPPADYKLAVHTTNHRGVYTFCMCPGGYVVNASSEPGMLAVNGMSNFKRDAVNANSAVLVSIGPEDFGSDHPLAGMEYQQKIEKAAFQIAGGDYAVPVQTLGSFLGKRQTDFQTVLPSVLPKFKVCDLHSIFPQTITEALKEGLLLMDRKIKGFAADDAVLSAPETRSSSPVRILRNENGMSDIAGLYPCGEGAGYAGGIMSAAVDGIKCAEKIIHAYS